MVPQPLDETENVSTLDEETLPESEPVAETDREATREEDAAFDDDSIAETLREPVCEPEKVGVTEPEELRDDETQPDDVTVELADFESAVDAEMERVPEDERLGVTVCEDVGENATESVAARCVHDTVADPETDTVATTVPLAVTQVVTL